MHLTRGKRTPELVDILEAALPSLADDGRPVAIGSTFEPPPLMGWAR